MNTIRAAIACALVLTSLPLSAHETKEKVSSPGFRPECELAATFIDNVESAAVVVYPTIIRTPTNTTFSSVSQQQVVDFLTGRKMTKAGVDTTELDPGQIKGNGQFDWFQNDMAVLGEKIRMQDIQKDYALIMEILFPPMRGDRQRVFGIHCIILDAKGENAFSFLLNSHHQMFVDAKMMAEDLSDKSRDELIKKATEVGLAALVEQIRHAGEEED